MKKIAVIGKGTAGSLTYNHFKHYTDFEIDVYYDSNKKEQAVGEGTTLNIPEELNITLGTEFHDLPKIDGNFKTSILYEGFGPTDYHHTFFMPNISIHMNAVKLQEYIYEKRKGEVNFIDKNIDDYNDIDSDYVIDCSGTPKDLSGDEYFAGEYIPVNTALVKQCSWNSPQFTHTLTKAMKHGWVFGIPLANRISFGYLYNRDINNKEEIKEELDQLIHQYNLVNDLGSSHIEFNNYFKKQNYTDRIAWNGNASFFLEPMEATSLATVEEINRRIFDITHGVKTLEKANQEYYYWFKQVQDIITMHYLAGSKYDTEFWSHAKKLATECLSIKSPEWQRILYNLDNPNFRLQQSYGSWGMESVRQNVNSLGIRDLL